MINKSSHRAASPVIAGFKAGISVIKLNKLQSVFAIICFAAAVCTAAAMWLYSASAADAAEYTFSPLGMDSVVLKLDGGDVGLELLRELSDDNPELIRGVIPYKTVRDTELYGNRASSCTGDVIVTDGALFSYPSVDIVRGRGINPAVSDSGSAVLSEALCEPLFGTSDPIGQQVRAGSRVYDVVGICRGTGGYDIGQSIIIPYTGARLILGSAETGEYIFSSAEGRTAEAADLIKVFLDERMNRSSNSAYNIEIPEKGESKAGGVVLVFALLLALSCLCLIMFSLFPGRTVRVSSRFSDRRSYRLYSAAKCGVLCLVLSACGAVLGLLLGLLSAFIICSMSGLALYAAASEALPVLCFALSALSAGILSAVVPVLRDLLRRRIMAV